jgi:hypothetical protein
VSAEAVRALRCAADHGGECFYCGRPLSTRHEHDHFPVAHHHGGTHTVPACLACHAELDRTPIEDWNPTVVFGGLMGLWAKASTSERLVLAKMIKITDALAAMLDGHQQG